LQNKGFVRLVDVMGSDAAVVQAARVSYGEGTKSVSDDRALIRYLLRHAHTTPFEMCEMKFHVKVPIDTWRQWIRHRTASVNEYSTRYSVAIDDKAETLPDEWRTQSGGNKQGSGGYLSIIEGEKLTTAEKFLHEQSDLIYHDRLAVGVAREQARKDLPLSTYTEAYWKIDLHNLLHFLKLRLHPHAQLEIRQYAEEISKDVQQAFPITWSAFTDYTLNSLRLSALDIAYINKYGLVVDTIGLDLIFKNSKREKEECIEKLKALHE